MTKEEKKELSFTPSVWLQNNNFTWEQLQVATDLARDQGVSEKNIQLMVDTGMRCTFELARVAHHGIAADHMNYYLGIKTQSQFGYHLRLTLDDRSVILCLEKANPQNRRIKRLTTKLKWANEAVRVSTKNYETLTQLVQTSELRKTCAYGPSALVLHARYYNLQQQCKLLSAVMNIAVNLQLANGVRKP